MDSPHAVNLKAEDSHEATVVLLLDAILATMPTALVPLRGAEECTDSH